MTDDNYSINIEEGADLVIKKERFYLVGKMVGVPEDMGLPPDDPFMKQKVAIFYGEDNILNVTGKNKTFGFSIDHDSCKQLAEFLMKVYNESQ